jgi:hypothetical protein
MKKKRFIKVQEMLKTENFKTEENFKGEFDWDSMVQIGKHSFDGSKSVWKMKNKNDNKIYAVKIWQKLMELSEE